jgi:hypothetical protein
MHRHSRDSELLFEVRISSLLTRTTFTMLMGLKNLILLALWEYSSLLFLDSFLHLSFSIFFSPPAILVRWTWHIFLLHFFRFNVLSSCGNGWTWRLISVYLRRSEVGLPGTGTQPLVEFDADDDDGTVPYRLMGTAWIFPSYIIRFQGFSFVAIS